MPPEGLLPRNEQKRKLETFILLIAVSQFTAYSEKRKFRLLETVVSIILNWTRSFQKESLIRIINFCIKNFKY